MTDRPRTDNQFALMEYKARFLSDTRYGSELLDLFTRSNCGVWRFERDIRSGVPRWWLNITLPPNVAEMFDLRLEIQVLYAEYEHMEPRAMDLLRSRVRKGLRVDPGVAIIASLDPEVADLVRRRRGELSVLDIHLPSLATDRSDIRQRLSSALTAVDHYDVTNPVQDPSGFFGRKEEVALLTHAINRGQSVGVFGLRKAGKTSLLNAIKRIREDEGRLVVQLDVSEISSAQAFKLSLLRETWSAVRRLEPLGDEGPIRMPKTRLLNVNGDPKADLSELDLFWTEDLKALIKASGRRLELIIDEIDQAFPARSNLLGDEPLRLFQTLTQLRGLIQMGGASGGVVLLCAGVDPSLFERAQIDGRDNLIYKLVRLVWLAPMGRADMAEMVRMLGKRMGVRIRDHEAIDLLFAEYGGHPLLTRKACSYALRDRDVAVLPWELGTAAIESAVRQRGLNSTSQQVEDVFLSFREWFPEESEVLELLWSRDGSDRALAESLLADNPDALEHAKAYGLVQDDGEPRIGALRSVAMP